MNWRERDEAGFLSVQALVGQPAPQLRLTLPLDRAELAQLRAGQSCLLNGVLYTLRDAGHVRLLEELASRSAREDESLPYGLAGQTLFYAGPTPEQPGAERPFGAIGPTTASRMDFAAPELYDRGIVATIGKGARSSEVQEACVRNGAVYLIAVGGAAAYLATHVTAAEVLAYDDLGTEALRRIHVIDFPVFVGIDTLGNDVYSQTHNEPQ